MKYIIFNQHTGEVLAKGTLYAGEKTLARPQKRSFRLAHKVGLSIYEVEVATEESWHYDSFLRTGNADDLTVWWEYFSRGDID